MAILKKGLLGAEDFYSGTDTSFTRVNSTGGTSTLAKAGFGPAFSVITVGKLDNIRVLDGPTFAKTGAGANAAVADIGSGTAGIIFVPFPGDYSDAVIALGKKHVLVFGAGTFTVAGITGPDSSTDATGTWAVLGQGVEQTTLFLANTQNRDVITSPNFGTLTGGTNFWGVFHPTIANLTIDANKANNLTAGFGIRLYGRAGSIQNVIVQNARQDGIWLEWNGTTDFTLPTGDLEWRIYNVKTTFCVGNGFTNKAQSDMVIHGLIGYKNGGWGIQVFFATRMSASNFFLNTLGGSNAATGGDAAGFFGTDNQCTSATGVGLQIDVGADVGSSVISGVFGAPIAVKVGTQSNYITGQFVNSTTAAIQFIGAGSNANFIEGIVYGNTGTLVDWNAGSPGGGNSTILLGGTSPGGAATMFTGTTPTANTIWIDAVGLTGSPYRQFSSIDSSVSFTKAGVAVTFRNAANGYITIQNSASAASSFIDFYNSSGTRLGFIGNHDAQNQWVSNANAPFVLSGADTRVKRIKASTDAGATTLVAGDFALSAGWGTTASIGSLRGVDQWHEFVITSAGTGQGANPTLTLTYKDLTWTVAPIVRCSRQEFASQPTVPFTVTTQSATTYVLTFGGTPVAGETYRVACFVGGI